MISQLNSFQDLAAHMQSTLSNHQSPHSDSLLSVARQVALEANVAQTQSERGSVTSGSLRMKAQLQIGTWLEGQISDDVLTEVSSNSATSQTNWALRISAAASVVNIQKFDDLLTSLLKQLSESDDAL
jgi:hypothetical protein